MVAGFRTFVEVPLGWLLLWLGLAALTGGLIAIMRSKWGRSRPLRNYVILSLLAHVLLAAFATTIRIVASVRGSPTPPVTHVTIVVDDQQPVESTEDREFQPWEGVARDRLASDALDLAFGDPSEFAAPPSGTASARSVAEFLTERKRPVEADWPRLEDIDSLQTVPAIPTPRPAATLTSPTSAPESTTGEPSAIVRADSSDAALLLTTAESVDVASQPVGYDGPDQQPVDAEEKHASRPAELRETKDSQERPIVPVPAPLASNLADNGEMREGRATGESPAAASTASSSTALPNSANVPSAYRNRFAPDRDRIVAANGGDSDTEAAVEAALRWLADNQAADGRWDADQHGAGREQTVLGHDRQGAGFRADTGITGLALLALLGAGHTHLAGPYRDNIAQGIAFLSRSQRSDGSLGGQASLYAHMYCHAMATFALSEAYAMTHAPSLDPPVRRAVAYSVASQHPQSGGWRYQAGDPGDTSQLGWQVMALRSADLAGIVVPAGTR
ncbi:MAG: hypothetical protein ACC645_18360, partial [Pirellulales bacterium]